MLALLFIRKHGAYDWRILTVGNHSRFRSRLRIEHHQTKGARFENECTVFRGWMRIDSLQIGDGNINAPGVRI